MTVKPTNPKDAVGIRKVPFWVIPPRVLAEIGLSLLEGARKYGPYNWRHAGVRGSVYYDASLRHMTSWMEGQDIDPESGVHHISKAIASLVVLRDGIISGIWVDDRPPPTLRRWIQECNILAGEIIDRTPQKDVDS
jgi:hypothetical protein